MPTKEAGWCEHHSTMLVFRSCGLDKFVYPYGFEACLYKTRSKTKGCFWSFFRMSTKQAWWCENHSTVLLIRWWFLAKLKIPYGFDEKTRFSEKSILVAIKNALGRYFVYLLTNWYRPCGQLPSGGTFLFWSKVLMRLCCCLGALCHWLATPLL